MIGQTKRIRRAILAALRPMTGDRSSGEITATASGGNITVPKNSFLVPVLESAAGNSQLEPNWPIRVVEDTLVAAGGTTVTVTSLIGGSANNLADGTMLRWDPPLVGLTETAVVSGGGLTGGADATAGAPGALKSLVSFEEIRSREQAQALFQAGITNALPAGILAWTGTNQGRKVGAGVHIRDDTWELYLVVTWSDEGLGQIDRVLDLLDAAESYLVDRKASDGFPFSAPDGTDILGRQLVRQTAGSLIYSVRFATMSAVQRVEHRSVTEGSWAAWAKTVIDLETATTPPLPVVDGVKVDMT